MMKKLILILFVVSLFLLVGCKQLVPDDSSKKMDAVKELKNITEEKPVEKKVAPKVEVKEMKPTKCTHNSNCTGGKYCVEGECKLLADFLQKTGCEKNCNYQKIKITTSDGEKYLLSRGQGSYTAASALEWTIRSMPDYCKGETILVPFKILKRNYGKVFADELIVLKVGETSKAIKHPLMPEIAFTLRVESVEESCSS